MSDRLVHSQCLGLMSMLMQPHAVRIQVRQKPLVAAVIFRVRQMLERLEQCGLVVRLDFAHGGAVPLVGDDALRVTAKGSAPVHHGCAA